MLRRVLVVEDDPHTAELLRMHVSHLPCEVHIAYDGAVALAQAQANRYDLILLDIMLPGMNGIDVCSRLRLETIYTPIIMVTAKATETDRVLGLALGADDYVTKPFSVAELLARVKAIFRRIEYLKNVTPQSEQQIMHAGRLSINGERRDVILDGKSIKLTPTEFDLLLHFARHPGRVFSRGDVLNHVWGYNYCGNHHIVDSHIHRLREKIEDDLHKPEYVRTVRGVGYKFVETLPKT